MEGRAAWVRSRTQRPPGLRTALLLLVALVLASTFGLMLIEQWDFWKAFFFTLITITTVGYGDEGISQTGEKFATVLLVGGIGLASYTFAVFIQTLVTNSQRWKYRMQTEIDNLRNHTIVCGFGRMGRIVTEELAESGAAFVVIDKDATAVERAHQMGYLAIEGVASEDSVLQSAGIYNAAHLVSVVDAESENIVITLTAHDLREDLSIIARAEGERGVRKLRRAGASGVTSPYHSGGLEVANRILRPRAAELLLHSQRAGSGLLIAEIKVEEHSALVGQSLREYGQEHATRIAYVALDRPGETAQIPPSGQQHFRENDLIIVAGDPTQVSNMSQAAHCSGRLAPELDGAP